MGYNDFSSSGANNFTTNYTHYIYNYVRQIVPSIPNDDTFETWEVTFNNGKRREMVHHLKKHKWGIIYAPDIVFFNTREDALVYAFNNLK